MEQISVIMPVYNGEKFVEKAIKSVLNQTYKNFELIIVNDGSIDDTEKICLKYIEDDSRIKYLKIENSGPSVARNIGIEKANGNYIMFIDSDDFYMEEMIEKMLQEAKKGYDCIICNRILKNENKEKKSPLENKIMNGKDKFMEYLQINRLFNEPTNKMYSTKIIKENNLEFDSDFICGEDYKFNIDYFDKIKNAKFINEFLYVYVANPNSITHDIRNFDFFNIVKIIDYNKEMYLRNGYPLENLYYRYIIALRDGIAYNIIAQKKYKKVREYINKCIEYPSIQEIVNRKYKIQKEEKIIYFFIKHKMKRIIYFYLIFRNKIKSILKKIKS